LPANQMEKEVSEDSRSDADENSVEEFEQEFLKQQKKARVRNFFLLFVFILGLAVGGYLSWLRSGLIVREPESEVAETTEPDFLILDKEPDFTIGPPVKKPAVAKKPAETMVAKPVSEARKKPKPQPAAKTAKQKPVARKAAKKPTPVSNAAQQKLPAKEATKISPVEMGKPSAVKPPAVAKKPAETMVAKPVSEARKKPKPQPVAKTAEKKPAAKEASLKAETVKPEKPVKAVEPAVRQEKAAAQAKTAPVKVAGHKKPGVEKRPAVVEPGVSYYLQIGIFSKKKYAQKMADFLKSLGLNPSYREMNISLTDYLVSAGPYGSREEADEAVKRISQKGYSVKAVESADGVYRLDFGKFRSGKEAGETASGLEKLGIKAQVEKKRKKLPATMVVVKGIKGEDELNKAKKSLDDKKVKYYVKKSPL